MAHTRNQVDAAKYVTNSFEKEGTKTAWKGGNKHIVIYLTENGTTRYSIQPLVTKQERKWSDGNSSGWATRKTYKTAELAELHRKA